MRFRDPRLITGLGFAAGWLFGAWMRTLSVRYRALGPVVRPEWTGPDRYVCATWHEHVLGGVFLFVRPRMYMLASAHADGRLIAALCRSRRLRCVEGSTRHGGAGALRQLVRLARDHHLGITPDGPQGPRRQLQPGLIYLAARSGRAIVPVGIGFDRPWRLQSWDRFAIPRPLSRATVVVGPPITVPARPAPDLLEVYRRRVEGALNSVTAAAERWAETGRWPGCDLDDAEAAPAPGTKAA